MSPKKISKYVKYTAEELENYKNAEGSCVQKMNANLHITVLPYCLKDFKTSLLKLLSSKKIGSYDEDLEGIILDIHNIKVIGTSGAIRFDDPKIHLDLISDCYVFKPFKGAIVRGTIRHISSSQIGVIVYRVFSVSIRLSNKSNIKLEVNTEIDFRIKDFNLQHIFPYIEGELVHNIIKPETDRILRSRSKSVDPEDIKNVIELIGEIKADELNDSTSVTPPKPKKRKKEIAIKTEK